MSILFCPRLCAQCVPNRSSWLILLRDLVLALARSDCRHVHLLGPDMCGPNVVPSRSASNTITMPRNPAEDPPVADQSCEPDFSKAKPS